MDENNSKIQTYIVGGLVGAVVGVIAAYLLDKSAALEGEESRISGKKASRTAMGVISLLWSLIEKAK